MLDFGNELGATEGGPRVAEGRAQHAPDHHGRLTSFRSHHTSKRNTRARTRRHDGSAAPGSPAREAPRVARRALHATLPESPLSTKMPHSHTVGVSRASAPP